MNILCSRPHETGRTGTPGIVYITSCPSRPDPRPLARMSCRHGGPHGAVAATPPHGCVDGAARGGSTRGATPGLRKQKQCKYTTPFLTNQSACPPDNKASGGCRSWALRCSSWQDVRPSSRRPRATVPSRMPRGRVPRRCALRCPPSPWTETSRQSHGIHRRLRRHAGGRAAHRHDRRLGLHRQLQRQRTGHESPRAVALRFGRCDQLSGETCASKSAPVPGAQQKGRV